MAKPPSLPRGAPTPFTQASNAPAENKKQTKTKKKSRLKQLRGALPSRKSSKAKETSKRDGFDGVSSSRRGGQAGASQLSQPAAGGATWKSVTSKDLKSKAARFNRYEGVNQGLDTRKLEGAIKSAPDGAGKAALQNLSKNLGNQSRAGGLAQRSAYKQTVKDFRQVVADNPNPTGDVKAFIGDFAQSLFAGANSAEYFSNLVSAAGGEPEAATNADGVLKNFQAARKGISKASAGLKDESRLLPQALAGKMGAIRDAKNKFLYGLSLRGSDNTRQGNVSTKHFDYTVKKGDGDPVKTTFLRTGNPTVQSKTDNPTLAPESKALFESLADDQCGLCVSLQKTETSCPKLSSEEQEGLRAKGGESRAMLLPKAGGTRHAQVEGVSSFEVKQEARRSEAITNGINEIKGEGGEQKGYAVCLPADGDYYNQQGMFADTRKKNVLGRPTGAKSRQELMGGKPTREGFAREVAHMMDNNQGGFFFPESVKEKLGGGNPADFGSKMEALVNQRMQILSVPEGELSADDRRAILHDVRDALVDELIVTLKPSFTMTPCKELVDRGAILSGSVALKAIAQTDAYQGEGGQGISADGQKLASGILNGPAATVHGRSINGNFKNLENYLGKRQKWNQGNLVQNDGFTRSISGVGSDDTGIGE